MAQSLFEPMVIVSRSIKPSLSRSTTMLRSSTHHMSPSSSSKIETMSNLIISKTPESDDDIEVLGPFPKHGFKTPPKTRTKVDNNNTNKASPSSAVETDYNNRKLQGFSVHALRREAETRMAARSIATLSTDCSSSTVVAPELLIPNIAGLAVAHVSKPADVAKGPKEPPSDLPIYSYKDYANPKPYVVYTTDESETDDLVGALKPGPIAFDMEWRFFYTRSKGAPCSTVERRTAVVQVADSAGLILVIQVYPMTRFPKQLQALIENADIAKLGVNILNDGKKLFRDYGILAKNLVELGAIALVADPASKTKRRIVSLAKLTARFCNKELNKGQERTSNWEAPLDARQLEYSANDVHSSMMIYQRLLEVAKEQSVELPALTAFSADVEPFFDSPAISRTSSMASTDSTQTVEGEKTIMRPQYLRAYRFWYERGMDMEEMCIKLSTKVPTEGLKVSTVITYIVSALQADPKLPFEMVKLKDLVQMDGQSWVRHRSWILTAWAEGWGVQSADVDTNNESHD